MAVTLKDVAAFAGVHPSTVSRVLRGKEILPISVETREKIIHAAKTLKYHPDQRARALRLGKSNTIGLIIPDISNWFFSEIAKSIEHHCYTAGYTLIVCASDEDQDKEIRFVDDLISRGVDGLIIAPVQDSFQHIQDLIQNNFPFVLIDREFENLQTNAVVSDNYQASYNLVKYLTSQGHHRIGFLRARKSIYTIQKRLEGFLDAVNTLGLDNSPDLIVGDGFTSAAGFDATSRMLALKPPPTAIISSGNSVTFGAIQSILSMGLNIPNDISLVAFTDTHLAPFLICPLATVTHPLEEMGHQAFTILIEHIDDKKNRSISRVEIKTRFNNRESVQALSLAIVNHA